MKNYFLSALFLLVIGGAWAQETEYKFEEVKKVATTPVKNQGRTGTCWSYTSSSFIESEALRQEKDTVDVSEMYFVRRVYPKKAVNFVQNGGKANHSQGGLAHDVTSVIADFGIVPEEAYLGRKYQSQSHDHSEMANILKGVVSSVAESKSKTELWLPAYENVLNTYLGAIPTEFMYKKKWYTPQAFARDVVGFNTKDYVELTSFTHKDYYSQFAVEVPDNWDKTNTYYNLPLDELMQVMENAINTGYSINWDGDVSEKEFMHKKGLAIFPEKNWKKKKKKEQKKTGVKYEKEKEVTAELRQKLFESKETTDDHLMHIVGISKDAKGRKYFITKNSWGTKNPYGGYLHMSFNYVKAKTIAVMVHKDAIPAEISAKLFK